MLVSEPGLARGVERMIMLCNGEVAHKMLHITLLQKHQLMVCESNGEELFETCLNGNKPLKTGLP